MVRESLADPLVPTSPPTADSVLVLSQWASYLPEPMIVDFHGKINVYRDTNSDCNNFSDGHILKFQFHEKKN